MDINQLIEIVKKKINQKISCEKIEIEDKTFLHESHQSHQRGKFHIKLIINSKKFQNMTKIESHRAIFSVLNDEMKNKIHAMEIVVE